MPCYKLHVLGALLTTLLPACSTFDLRSVQPVDKVNSIAHYPGDGGVIISSSIVEGKGICVAPPSQSAVTVTFSGDRKKKTSVKLSEIDVSMEQALAVSLAETLSKLYEQNEQTLFLQHSLYRLCEAYTNGLFKHQLYSEWLETERIEATAEANRLTALAWGVDELRTEIADKQRAITALEAEVKTAPSDAGRLRIEEMRKQVEKLNRDLSDAATASERAQAVRQLANDLKTRVDTVRSYEKSVLEKADQDVNCGATTSEGKRYTLPRLECRARYMEQLSRIAYMEAVDDVMKTAVRLSEIDVERHRASVELAKAEAEKAKADVAKAKAEEVAKKNASIVEDLHAGAIAGAKKALETCGDKCKEAPKKEEK